MMGGAGRIVGKVDHELCRKRDALTTDVGGSITSQLYNANEPMTLFDRLVGFEPLRTRFLTQPSSRSCGRSRKATIARSAALGFMAQHHCPLEQA